MSEALLKYNNLKNATYLNKIINDDCFNILNKLEENSIATCIADPPYNYEIAGKEWDQDEIDRRINRVQNSSTLVKNMPYGSGLSGGVRNKRWYERNHQNNVSYMDWTKLWGKELFRVLKNGSYLVVFNSNKSIAHIQIALEVCGFYTKDVMVWKKNSGIPKGLNVSKKLEKEQFENFEEWKGWHSCLRNEWEAILIVQKPLLNNHIITLKENDLGLLYAEREGHEGFLSNIIDNIKPEKKDSFNTHITVKPLALIEELITLTTPKNKNHTILDPFVGSGTTCLAAKKLGFDFIGIEKNKEYYDIASKRIHNFQDLFIL